MYITTFKSIANCSTYILRYLKGGIHQRQAGSGTGGGGVEPTIKIGGTVCFRGDIAHIDEHRCPLPALSFMAGNGIGIFHLEGIVIWVGFQSVADGGDRCAATKPGRGPGHVEKLTLLFRRETGGVQCKSV